MDKPFLTDIKELWRRARTHMEEAAVTDGYRADRIPGCRRREMETGEP